MPLFLQKPPFHITFIRIGDWEELTATFQDHDEAQHFYRLLVEEGKCIYGPVVH